MKRDKAFTEWFDGLDSYFKDYIDVLYEAYQLGKNYRKKVKKESEPCFKAFVEIWCKAYPLIGFQDGPTSGRCINEIIGKIRKVMEARGKEPTCEALENSFQYVIDYVKRVNHFVDEKPLTTWNSQYLSIVTEIFSGKQYAKTMTAKNSSQVFGKYV